MKKIYFMLLAMLAMNFVFTACSDEAPFSTATPNDEPRILDPVFPDRVNGNLPTVAISTNRFVEAIIYEKRNQEIYLILCSFCSVIYGFTY